MFNTTRHDDIYSVAIPREELLTLTDEVHLLLFPTLSLLTGALFATLAKAVSSHFRAGLS